MIPVAPVIQDQSSLWEDLHAQEVAAETLENGITLARSIWYSPAG